MSTRKDRPQACLGTGAIVVATRATCPAAPSTRSPLRINTEPGPGMRGSRTRLLTAPKSPSWDTRLAASSGQTTRHRLSRGGDRQLNRALHTIVLHRRQHDPATRDYIAHRIAEGSRRNATRLLKRYLARHLCRLLQQQQPMMA